MNACCWKCGRPGIGIFCEYCGGALEGRPAPTLYIPRPLTGDELVAAMNRASQNAKKR